jgi:UDP-N-acetylmuramoylalanine--D-glutamate ligase
MELLMKNIVILGAGESGVGAALLAQKLGFKVFVSDKSAIKDNFRAELDAANIEYESGSHDENRIFEADQIVKSPGIPDKIELIQALILRGLPIVSEIEFAYQCLPILTKKKPFIIAITGSNGKTTTTGLTYHLLKTAQANVAVGGNIGKSFARLLTEKKIYDYYVLELSSFQLDGITTFRPNVSMILNITPDHLDRYDYKFENYVASKFRIMMNQTEGDTVIYNGNDAELDKKLRHYRGDVTTIPVWMNDWKAGKRIGFHEILVTPNFGRKKLETVEIDEDYDVTNPHLQGPHNFFNAFCAIHAFRATKADKSLIQRGLDTFVNAPHRLEFVGNVNGTDYFNDSKATNVDSVFWALSAMTKPTILILGGQDKGNDYRQIEDLVRRKVKAIVAMGVDNSKILSFFGPIVKNLEETASAAEAVSVAAKYAEGGDAVLLSPACASFDLFKNYEDRGEQFKKAVLKFEV